VSDQTPLAIIFDFDGVVADTLEMHLTAWVNAVRIVFGVHLDDPDKIRRHSTVTIAHILAKRHGEPQAAGRLAAAKWEALKELGTPPFVKGAARLIAHVETRGLPWGIASNSPGVFVETAVRGLGINPAALIATDEPHRRKPRPDIFWDCANHLGVLPPQRKNVLVFEDSAHGIVAALAAGMQPYGVVGAGTAAELRNAGALRVGLDLDTALDEAWF
jgi:beta-phosphoglucomutase